MSQRLLIVGASARAAAMSAKRGRFSPIAADLFGDWDLCTLCPTTKVNDYPHGLAACARSVARCCWMYTGALENHPELVDRIAHYQPLLGNRGDVLRRVRDPFVTAGQLARAGLPFLQVRRGDRGPGTGRWLQKPLKSSGGNRIVPAATAGIAANQPARSACYFQQYVDGWPCGAVYISSGGQAVLLGITRQLIATDWLGATGFRYAGSVGPCPMSNEMARTLEQIGQLLAEQFQLTGLFGVDVVVRGNELWPVEVNPRYTASVEVLERARGMRAVALHVDACRSGILPTAAALATTQLVCGKAIKYATCDFTMSAAAIEFAVARNRDAPWPVYADLPHQGTVIRRGTPIATAFASGTSLDDVVHQLKEKWRQFELHCR